MTDEAIEARLLKARRWAREAGRKALDAFRSIEPEWKGDQEELITESDRAIEADLRERISDRFPDDSIVGEEEEPFEGTNDVTWYLDPIDGTAAYSMSLPIWCVSIGIFRDHEPAAGVLLAPFMDEEFHGSRATGPHKDGRPLVPDVSSPAEWTSETLLGVTSNTHRAYDIEFPGKCRSLGSSAYHLGLVTDGRAVGALIGRLRLWDVAGVLGLASGNDHTLVTIEGNDPDWDRFLTCEKSEDPLLYTHQSLVDELTDRIRER